MKKVGISRASASLTFVLGLSVPALLATSCVRKPPNPRMDPAAYAREIDQWHQQRWAELKSESGWLTLVGLFWLKKGENKFGSDPSNDIALPKLSKFAGSFWLKDGSVKLAASPQSGITADGKSVTSLELKSDADGDPTIVHVGSLSLQIIRRGDKLGLRVKDKDNPDRVNFKGTEFYPTDQKWRIEAHFEPYNPPKPVPISNVLGMESEETSPGAVVFEVDGQTYRLDAITEKGESKLFMIIADKTSGKGTYPAGRYLYVDPPNTYGKTIIDFNEAYGPPCAFTKFATCPLPPKQNRLPFAIEAGEKYNRHPQ